MKVHIVYHWFSMRANFMLESMVISKKLAHVIPKDGMVDTISNGLIVVLGKDRSQWGKHGF